MKKFRFIDIYYLLPVLLLGLTASPNIVGWRIGTVMLVSLVLAVVSANYLSARVSEIRRNLKGFKILDILLVFSLAVLVWQSTKINLDYTLAVLIYILMYTVYTQVNDESRIRVLLSPLIGLIFWSGIYLGLNQYAFSKIFRLALLEYLVVGSLLFAYLSNITSDFGILKDSTSQASVNHTNRQVSILFRLLLLAFVLLLGRNFQTEHVVLFVVLQLPVVYSYFLMNKAIQSYNLPDTKMKIQVFRQISIISLIVFLVYLFLDSTQVLQAVMGGY